MKSFFKSGFLFLAYRGVFNWIPDKAYLKLMFWAHMGKTLDLKNPKTFNEKLQWLKLYDRKPEYTAMVDKYAVREYIADIIGEEYLVPLLGVWDNPDYIDFDALPNQFVLKCNHNSGLGMCICKDKTKIDINMVKNRLKKGLKQDFYKEVREWPYKNVKRKIIAEQYLENKSDNELKDYKLLCFNGAFMCSFVCSERHSAEGLKVTFFDKDWNEMPFERHYPKSTMPINKPKCYEKMIELAEKLANDIRCAFVRVDFYEFDEKLYFGEITFYPGSGFEKFTPEEWDYKLGEMIKL